MECPACNNANADGSRFCQKCGAPLPVKGSEADPLIGKMIANRYRVIEVIGEGGMGRVYSGEQQMGTKVRKVAIKTLLSQFAKDPQTVGRFMRECGTISELEHPNTIKVYDFGQIEGSQELYVAMEFLSGQSLEQALLAGPLPPERVDRILGQVCGSLAEAHEKGIVHRDLKPANIFLTTRAGEEDVVKVLDFGIAKTEEKPTEQKLTQQGTILGTPPYMSPEQFTGKALDTRSDVYSLAVVAYEMLAGRLPFEADTPWEWATQHMTAQPFPFEATPMGNQVPAKMRNAIMRGMAKDREQRPQNVRDFYNDLTLGDAPRLSMVAQAPRTSSGVSLPGLTPGPTMPSGGGTQAGQHGYGQPPGPPVEAHYAHGPAHGPAPGLPPPPPTKGKSGGGGMGIVIAIIAVLVLGGGAAGIYFATQGDETTAKGSPSGSASGGPAAPPPSTKTSGPAQAGSTAPTAPTTPAKRENIDVCCAQQPAGTKKFVCEGTNDRLKKGDITRAEALEQLQKNRINCK
jgi:serine/threonine protein kinase